MLWFLAGLLLGMIVAVVLCSMALSDKQWCPCTRCKMHRRALRSSMYHEMLTIDSAKLKELDLVDQLSRIRDAIRLMS